MDIVVRVAGEVVVDHELDRGDVEASAGDVGGDEDAGALAAECGEVGGALFLGELGVQGGAGVGEGEEGAVEEVGGFGAVGED